MEMPALCEAATEAEDWFDVIVELPKVPVAVAVSLIDPAFMSA
jgi:hypothetical protein